jgi:hypothetical protein
VPGDQGGAGTTGGDPTEGGADRASGHPAAAPKPGPAPTAQSGSTPAVTDPEPGSIVQRIVDDVSREVAATVRPAAVVAVAEAFTFPLILMVAVLLFLVGQGRMEDPKLRRAPLSRSETTIRFEDEAGT